MSAVKKSQATIPAACWHRNAFQVVVARRGAGSSLWRRSVVRIAVAETCTPSRCSSPSAGSRQDAADRGEQGPVGGLELGTLDLAAEHGELVTQDEDLQVLGGVPTGEQGEQLDGAAQREVGEVRQRQVSSAVGAQAPPYQPLRPGTPAHGSRPSLRTPQESVMHKATTR